MIKSRIGYNTNAYPQVKFDKPIDHHLTFSIIKSVIRLISGICILVGGTILLASPEQSAAWLFVLGGATLTAAEVFGIIEEINPNEI